MTYDEFKEAIQDALRQASEPLTWTEIRTTKRLPQLFPNNGWVRRMESDIGLDRKKDSKGIIHWSLKA